MVSEVYPCLLHEPVPYALDAWFRDPRLEDATEPPTKKRRFLSGKSLLDEESVRELSKEYFAIFRGGLEFQFETPRKDVWVENHRSIKDGVPNDSFVLPVKYLDIRDNWITIKNDRKETVLHTQLPHDFPIPRLLGFHNIYHRCEPAPAAMYMATLHKLKRDDSLFYLEVRLLWHDSICIAGRQQLHHNVAHSLDKHFPGLSEPVRPESFTPGEFYENVHVPRADKDLLSTVRSDTLQCNLYPFQQRAVKWMLDREGVDILEGAKVRPRAETVSGLPPSFIETTDADGRPCFSSPLLRVITSDTSGCSNFHKTLKGGVLAEEMGLGKTVEVISLICLNQRAFHGSKAPHPGDSNGEGLIESGATLIITPPAILQQWKQEISNHAPNLVVFVYNGINDTKLSDGEVLKRLVSADVVLTTYQVLRREIFYAVDPPDRSLRHARKAHSRRSPLVQIFWWRVCLDEAQMVESGVSNAARVAQIIPRQLAWAITGTPLKKDINDVFGLLLFLRCEPFDDSMDIWNRLYQSFKPILKAEILGKIVLRHSKDQIREELRLPAQRRLVLTIPFTAVEEEYYDHLFKLMCDDCGLDAIGGPTRDDWDPARCTEKMRRWLIILRQTCLCPAKGTGGRRQHGPGGNAPLRPISEVLEVMIDQNETQYHFEERSLIQSQIRRGQLMENAQRPKEALALWQGALDKANDLVETCRIQLKAEIEKKNKEKMGQEKVREESQKEKKPPRDKRKTKKDDDDEEEDKKSRQTSYRQRLRFALEIKHTCKFFIGNAYYQIKSNFTLTEPDSDEFGKLEELEGNSYEDAKQIRKELLGEVNKRINQSLAGFRQKANDNDFVKLRKVWTKFEGGFESQKLADRLEGLCRLMNAQTEKYDYYRGLIVKMLTQQLVDEEDDAELQGDEYESSAKLQDDMFSYVEAIRVLHAYIHDTITGQQNTHVYRDVERNRERLKDKERYEVPPELYFKLMDEFDMLRATPELGSLRGLVVDIRSMIVALEWDVGEGRLYAPAELAITKSLLEQTTKLTAQQSKPLPELDREVESLGELFNKRLDYYRQLQQISDTVTPYQEENKGKPLDEEEFEKKLETEDSVLEKISALRARLRYLVYIRDESGAEESSRICIVCQSNIEIGVLTLCGHKYCEVCYGTWWTIHRTCPICKRHLGSKDCYPITYKSKDLVTQEETTAATEKSAGTATPAHPGKNAIYSDISTGAYREIQNIDLQASFSTKIDTLARHLIWLRQHDPGAKTVVFSQYKSFLDILGNALSKFKIGWIGVDSKNGIEQFKRDQAIECFLLHARAHSSGLNLVNATHVFLCEPLINTGIELQAIARVHRIGQLQETTVWMYLIADSVEESIYEISVNRRLEHIARRQKFSSSSDPEKADKNAPSRELDEETLDAANSLELQEGVIGRTMASRAMEGERVPEDDLWQCLFGKASRSGRRAQTVSRQAGDETSRLLRAEAADARRDIER